MEKITSENAPVVFLVPRNIFHAGTSPHTAREMDWLIQNPSARTKNVTFVLGSQQIFAPQFVDEIVRRRGEPEAESVLMNLLGSYREHLRQ
jgi:hypothetical protein